MPLFILLLLWPFAEIVVFMMIGEEAGFLNTILLCIAAAITGSFLIRSQGMKAFATIQTSLQKGDLPVMDIFNGICLYLAGILLILPGFISDGLAIILLIPVTRAAAHKLLQRFFVGAPIHARPRQTWRDEPDTIEGEFTRMDDTDTDLQPEDSDPRRLP